MCRPFMPRTMVEAAHRVKDPSSHRTAKLFGSRRLRKA
jgi:hypothetical protein